jgi:hypothetical protein
MCVPPLSLQPPRGFISSAPSPPSSGAFKDAERACRSRIDAVMFVPSPTSLFCPEMTPLGSFEKGEAMQRLRDEMSDLQKGAAQRIAECESELVRARGTIHMTHHHLRQFLIALSSHSSQARQREEFTVQFDDAMHSTDKEWRCRVDELKRACDASVQRESELKRSVELESLRRREADAALKEARECLAEVQEKLRDSLWRCDDLQGQVEAHVQSRDMLAIEHRTALERMKTSSERLLSEATATNRTLEAEAARLQDELTRARAVHAVDLQRLQVLSCHNQQHRRRCRRHHNHHIRNHHLHHRFRHLNHHVHRSCTLTLPTTPVNVTASR